ncbi:hypothetical protein ACFV23_03655 [Streptomyces sp. NPDC059627]
MPDVWIGLSAAALRRNWWWTGFLTFIWAGTTVAEIMTGPTSNRWWWGGGFGVAWLALTFYMINRGYGRTLLTAKGMEFRTLISRRSVSWAEIADIEKRQHQVRGGSWWDLRAVRVRGRSLTIPGAFTNRMGDPEFEQKLATVRACWARAVGG